jgi:hypothetical protein
VTAHLIDTATPGARVRRQDRRINVSRDAGSPREIRREQRPSPNVDQVLDDSFPASDPPSWTTAISRVASASTHQQSGERLVG